MYTLWAGVAAAVVVAVEVVWLRTGLFGNPAYWITLGITWAFQIPVDGWLTKLSAPIVIYDRQDLSGLRFPWDIPVEDFVYGFALVTLALLVWTRLGKLPSGAGATSPDGGGRGAGRGGGCGGGSGGDGSGAG